MRVLKLAYTRITDRAVTLISKMKGLLRLDLPGCKVTSASVGHLMHLKTLQQIYCEGRLEG